MAKIKTVKIEQVTDAESTEAKNNAMKDHMARIKKALRNEAIGEKSNLDRKIKVGQTLTEARDTMNTWKVSFKSIYESFDMKKSSADFYVKVYQEREKIADCKKISDAIKILYPKSSLTPEDKKKASDKKMDEAIEEKKKTRTPAQKMADVIKDITRIDPTMKNYHKLITVINDHFPVGIQDIEKTA